MGSPITMSGFNNIDFGMILNAVMQQESAPLETMKAQQKALQDQSSAFATLATKLGALQSAAQGLLAANALAGRAASSSDTTAVTVTANAAATTGSYVVEVVSLARAQVTTSTTTVDADTTEVATGGSLTIGGVTVTLTQPVTLQGLADAINGTEGIPVRATVVSPQTGRWEIVLTALETGAAKAFTVTNNLQGRKGGFGFSGTNAVNASDAQVRVNNVDIVSATNTISGAIGGATLTLLKQGGTATINVTSDPATGKALLKEFVAKYNELVAYADEQAASARTGSKASIGSGSLLRSLRHTLRVLLNEQYPIGGGMTSLAQAGIEFDRTGKLSFKESRYDAAIASGTSAVEKLLAGTEASPGVLARLAATIDEYVEAGGLVQSTRDRLDQQVQQVARRIELLNVRLASRRAALQKEFIAADMAMSKLNAQMSSLSSLGGQYQLF